jgi:hypothetical protein
MKVKLLEFKENWNDILISSLAYIGVAWVIVALLFQFTMIGMHYTGSDVPTQVGNWFDHKFNGNFKNSPGNIMYNAEDHIWVESVTNEVKIGKLAGNRKLEFGVKNILEEYLQERGLDLAPSATRKLKVSIIYLDVLSTKKNVSIFHSGEEEVVIRLRGTLYKDGKKDKEVIVEESSSEISMSTLIIDEGGKFNQTSLSNALKKGSDKLITKLLGEK